MAVTFRMIVFRPFIGEAVEGVVSGLDEDGVTISLDFFNDVYVPAAMLHSPSTFDTDSNQWVWLFEDREADEAVNGSAATSIPLRMALGDRVLCRVQNIEYSDTPAAATRAARAVFDQILALDKRDKALLRAAAAAAAGGAPPEAARSTVVREQHPAAPASSSSAAASSASSAAVSSATPTFADVMRGARPVERHKPSSWRQSNSNSNNTNDDDGDGGGHTGDDGGGGMRGEATMDDEDEDGFGGAEHDEDMAGGNAVDLSVALEAVAKPTMRVVASMMDDGFGVLKWWAASESQEAV